MEMSLVMTRVTTKEIHLVIQMAIQTEKKMAEMKEMMKVIPMAIH